MEKMVTYNLIGHFTIEDCQSFFINCWFYLNTDDIYSFTITNCSMHVSFKSLLNYDEHHRIFFSNFCDINHVERGFISYE